MTQIEITLFNDARIVYIQRFSTIQNETLLGFVLPEATTITGIELKLTEENKP